MKTKTNNFKRVKHIRYKDLDELTLYHKWRIVCAVIQIVATLGVPFVIVALNEYLKTY
jgi:hypothetical protein